MSTMDLAVLGILKEGDRHGYELRKRLGEALGPLAPSSYGSLYPALSRLARAGAVETTPGDEHPPIPATGALAGEAAAFRARQRRQPRRPAPRNRKVYRITAAGERRLLELLADPGDDDDPRAVAVRIAFCRWLEPAARRRLLADLRDRAARRAAALAEALAAGGDGDSWQRSLLAHERDLAEQRAGWLDGLLTAGPRPANDDTTETDQRRPERLSTGGHR